MLCKLSQRQNGNPVLAKSDDLYLMMLWNQGKGHHKLISWQFSFGHHSFASVRWPPLYQNLHLGPKEWIFLSKLHATHHQCYPFVCSSLMAFHLVSVLGLSCKTEWEKALEECMWGQGRAKGWRCLILQGTAPHLLHVLDVMYWC